MSDRCFDILSIPRWIPFPSSLELELFECHVWVFDCCCYDAAGDDGVPVGYGEYRTPSKEQREYYKFKEKTGEWCVCYLFLISCLSPELELCAS